MKLVALVALMSVWDWFDGDRSKELQQRAVVVIQSPNERPPGQKLGMRGPPKGIGRAVNAKADGPAW